MRWLLWHFCHKTIHYKWCVTVAILELTEFFALAFINRYTRFFKCFAQRSDLGLLSSTDSPTRQAPPLMPEPATNQQQFALLVYDEYTHSALALHVYTQEWRSHAMSDLAESSIGLSDHMQLIVAMLAFFGQQKIAHNGDKISAV